MRVFITKWWRGKGVYEAEVTPDDEMPNAVWDGKPGSTRWRYSAGDWFESLDEAVAHVTLLRESTIKNLKRELASMEKTANIKVKLLPTREVHGKDASR